MDPNGILGSPLSSSVNTLFYFLLAFSHCLADFSGEPENPSSHVCHDDLLVHHPGKLYYHYRKADPLYSGDLLAYPLTWTLAPLYF